MSTLEITSEKMAWGEEPEFFGPRDYFRNSLLVNEVVSRKDTGTLLDFGCGSGNLLLRLAKKGFNSIGMDESTIALDFLQSKIVKEKISNVNLIKSDDKTLSTFTKNFDIIVSGETIEHIQDDQTLVDNFFKLTNPNGICVISTPAHQYLWDINDDFSSHFRRYEANDLKLKFEKSGFVVEKVYYWGFPLSLLWHRYIYNPLIQNKIKNKTTYSKNSFLASFARRPEFTAFLSLPFYFDQIFNWTKRGGGLILVARKP